MVALICSVLCLAAPSTRALTFGLVSDIHHADVRVRGTRFYRHSMAKLREATAFFRERNVDGVFELGDCIDSANCREVERQKRYVAEVFAELRSVGKPVYAVLGNHCLQVLTKREFLEAAGLPRAHYSFTQGSWHFVVLDACHRRDGTPYGRGNFVWSDSEVPPAQLAWLRRDLERHRRLRTVVFVHQKLDGGPGDPLSVASSAAVRAVLERAGNVAAVFQGHDHWGGVKEINGIKYVTLAALVEGPYPSTAYSLLELRPDGSWSLFGYGRSPTVDE